MDFGFLTRALIGLVAGAIVVPVVSGLVAQRR